MVRDAQDVEILVEFARPSGALPPDELGWLATAYHNRLRPPPQARDLHGKVVSRPERLGGFTLFRQLGLATAFADPAMWQDGLRAALLEDKRFRRVIAASGSPGQVPPPETHRNEAFGAVPPTWNIRMLNIPALWDAGFTGEGVLIGHVDSGVDAQHQTLRGRVEAFAHFAPDGSRVEAAAADGSPDGHGTHTASTLVGTLTSKGAIGVAPGARLISARALHDVADRRETITAVVAALEWIATSGARVVNLSLGLWPDPDLPNPVYDPIFEPAIEAMLVDHYQLVVAAVGNEGAGTSRSPGNYADVLSVGAVDRNGSVAPFSGSQNVNGRLVPDLVAPGVRIIGAMPGGGYARLDGTSMAAPHIAGLAALLLQAEPKATPGELRLAILRSCRWPFDPAVPADAELAPVSLAEAPRHGAGIPDAVAALGHLRDVRRAAA